MYGMSAQAMLFESFVGTREYVAPLARDPLCSACAIPRALFLTRPLQRINAVAYNADDSVMASGMCAQSIAVQLFIFLRILRQAGHALGWAVTQHAAHTNPEGGKGQHHKHYNLGREDRNSVCGWLCSCIRSQGWSPSNRCDWTYEGQQRVSINVPDAVQMR